MSPLVGILGGSFNPAHSGHLYISGEARRLLGLDQILWLVAHHNPFKPHQPNFQERYRSAIKIAQPPWIEVSDFEHRHRTQNSFDSLSLWQQHHADKKAVLLMGADIFCELDRWHRSADIVRLMPLAIFPRLRHNARAAPLAARLADHILAADKIGELAQKAAPCLGFLPMAECDMSSTQRRGENQ